MTFSECLISNGVLNRAVSEAAGRAGTKMGYNSDDVNNATALQVIYVNCQNRSRKIPLHCFFSSCILTAPP